MSEKKTLIYIIGAGRSGTTLLDIVLGNSNAISLGEINRFFKRNGNPPKREIKDEVYNFWNEIKQRFDGISGNIDYEKTALIFNKNEYHLNVFKVWFKSYTKNYKRLLINLYGVITKNTNEDLLIESSKYPLRGLNISNFRKDLPFEISYVYIKKDPVKVVKSFNKKDIEQPSKGFFSANLYYLTVNILCYMVVKVLRERNHKISMVHYEDFIKDSKSVLEKIESDLCIDLSKSKYKIENKIALDTGFLFDGNRIRLKEKLFLRPDLKDEIKNVKYYFIRIFNFLVYK